jgi:hypothetical protein
MTPERQKLIDRLRNPPPDRVPWDFKQPSGCAIHDMDELGISSSHLGIDRDVYFRILNIEHFAEEVYGVPADQVTAAMVADKPGTGVKEDAMQRSDLSKVQELIHHVEEYEKGLQQLTSLQLREWELWAVDDKGSHVGSRISVDPLSVKEFLQKRLKQTWDALANYGVYP